MKAASMMVAALAAVVNSVAAKELPPNEALREVYDSGNMHMELKALKLVRPLRKLTRAGITYCCRPVGTARLGAER